MAYHLVFRCEEDDRIYSRESAAKLARISMELLELCEQEQLVRPQRMPAGVKGFTGAEIRQLARIRRLMDDLGLDLPAIEVVLHMRRRLLQLLDEVDSIENQMFRREQELYGQIWELRRRLADDGRWE